MKKSISKTLGIALFAVLMLFCTFFFTACGNSELESKVKDLEKQIQTLQNAQTSISNKDAMAVLGNLQNFAFNPNNYGTLNKPIGEQAMTSYAGIKNWSINSVDFTRSLGDTYNSQPNKLAGDSYLTGVAGVPLVLLDANKININEDYQKCYVVSGTSKVNYMVKIEMTENEMVIYVLNESVNGTVVEFNTAYRAYVTFTDAYTIKNIVLEKYQHRLSDNNYTLNTRYYIAGWAYDCSMQNTTVLGSGFATSMASEFSKATKADAAFDLQSILVG